MSDVRPVPLGRVYYATVATIIILAAIFFRILPFIDTFFPINDGALFLAFVQHINAHLYFFDPCVVYNGNCIPFSYPPLSFFAASGLLDLGLSPFDVGVIYPVGVSILIVFATLLFVRETIADQTTQLVALAATLLQTRSIEYLLMGGGISRSTGALFFLVALITAHRLTMARSGRTLLICGLAIGGAILSHLEWGFDAALGVSILMLLGSGLSFRRRFFDLCLLAVTSALAVIPWVGWTLSTHGLDPFVSASKTAYWSFRPVFTLLNLRLFPSNTALLCAVGAAVQWRRGQYAWIVMLIVFLFATPRHFGSVAIFPASILTAYGLVAILQWSLGILQSWKRYPEVNLGDTAAVHLQTAMILAVTALFSAILYSSIENGSSFRHLSGDVRAAAKWSKGAFRKDARSVIVTRSPWYLSREAEWWPYLTGHTNINTVQGSEWLGSGLFSEKIRQSKALAWHRDCTEWLANFANLGHVDYVVDLVSSGCFGDRARFEPAFLRKSITIYRVAGPKQ